MFVLSKRLLTMTFLVLLVSACSPAQDTAPAAAAPPVAPAVTAPAPVAPAPVAPAPAAPAAAAPAAAAPAAEAAPAAAAPAPAPAEITETADELYAQWMALATAATKEKNNLDETYAIAEKLHQKDPAKLQELVKVLADPAATPYTKVLAGISLRLALTPELKPQIIELTKPEMDATTRSCATELLLYFSGQDINVTLSQLAADPERRVRFQAMRGLAIRDPNHRKELNEWWKMPETTAQEKGSIVSALYGGVVASDSLWLFQEAAKDTAIDETARLMALRVMCQIGNQGSLPLLNELAANDPSENVRAEAKKASDMVTERAKRRAAAQAPKS